MPVSTPSPELDAVWRALANPYRRRMLELLRQHPRTTTELWVGFHADGLSRFAIMQHLAVLEEAGLVISGRFGRHRSYLLNPVPLQRLQEAWFGRFEGLRPPPMLRFLQQERARRQERRRRS